MLDGVCICGHGRPAHELARKHKPVDLKPVEVEVFDFRLLEMAGSQARFAIECGPGTYVRSLACDMGTQVGCGAHVSEITRTAVGEFTLDPMPAPEVGWLFVEMREPATRCRFKNCRHLTELDFKVANGELAKPKIWDPVLETPAEHLLVTERKLRDH